ncbi:MAG: 2-oxo acid dehydrogenase subunit E2 [Chitinophagaceae bacterium]|nr:2-oxo acid dehydrogenase subunit E2 [Chitinophagaceae bacterium]
MSMVDLVMPKLGESIMEATILKWHKKPGDTVAQDETVLDIATDKVDSEVPSTAAGILAEILFKENDVVPIGTVIARIRTGAVETAPAPSTTEPAPQASAPAAEEIESQEIPYSPATAPQPQQPVSVGSPRFYSPLVLKIAQEEGISKSELETIPGTGQDGRVSKKDILSYLQNRGQAASAPAPQPPSTSAPSVSVSTPQVSSTAANTVSGAVSVPSYAGNVEIIEMDRMRKMIAKHMVDSKHTSAHVTSFAECDVTNMVLWRDRVKKDFEKRESTKITFTPLFIEAVVKSIKKYPLLNSSVDGDRIVVKKDINIGMATALPTGNLIVPVIKNADQLNLVGLAKQVNGMAEAARTGKLRPDDTAGGTFTLTNVGTFGSIMGTPIINQPQVAIMAVGAIKKRPVVIETAQGDSIAIRHMMYISLSYDHRIIDGALGSTFLNAVARELENWDANREI